MSDDKTREVLVTRLGDDLRRGRVVCRALDVHSGPGPRQEERHGLRVDVAQRRGVLMALALAGRGVGRLLCDLYCFSSLDADRGFRVGRRLVVAEAPTVGLLASVARAAHGRRFCLQIRIFGSFFCCGLTSLHEDVCVFRFNRRLDWFFLYRRSSAFRRHSVDRQAGCVVLYGVGVRLAIASGNGSLCVLVCLG